MLSLHTIAATFTKIPELALPPEEARQMAEAIQNVASYYDLHGSDKALAWVNLFVCLGGIYGTRAYHYSWRLRQEAEAKKKVFPIAPQPAANPFATFTSNAAEATV